MGKYRIFKIGKERKWVKLSERKPIEGLLCWVAYKYVDADGGKQTFYSTYLRMWDERKQGFVNPDMLGDVLGERDKKGGKKVREIYWQIAGPSSLSEVDENEKDEKDEKDKLWEEGWNYWMKCLPESWEDCEIGIVLNGKVEHYFDRLFYEREEDKEGAFGVWVWKGGAFRQQYKKNCIVSGSVEKMVEEVRTVNPMKLERSIAESLVWREWKGE